MAHRDRLRAFNPSVTMRIKGAIVNKLEAKILYRCEECLGELKYWNNGLACASDINHKGFIHKKEVPAILAAREAQATAVEAAYEIVDGQLRPRKEIIQ